MVDLVLRFTQLQLNECHLTIEDLKTEITKEKEQRLRERSEYEQQLREVSSQAPIHPDTLLCCDYSSRSSSCRECSSCKSFSKTPSREE